MKDQPFYKVAVLLPVMNEAELIERCLSSIVNQDLTNVILLIQENCSDDGSAQIVATYRDKFPNIHVYSNQNRVDSWENWDFLLANAIKDFQFEYLFWIGGDDYFDDEHFLRDLYTAAVVGKLQIVTPNVNVLEGETGKLKETIRLSLNSKFMFFRTLKYCTSWKNVNLFHSLISRDLYLQTLQVSNNSHTNYIGNDWWVGLSILSSSKVHSIEKCYFNKSQWGMRRYEWISGIQEFSQNNGVRQRLFQFVEHIFQDLFLLRNHVLRSHPIRNNLSRMQYFVVVISFSVRAMIMPFVRTLRYISIKSSIGSIWS
jgi:glycosyltransferase involved in cell wall biosynthesis